jgi:hypothetical protein
MTQHVLTSKLKYLKIWATCFSYNEPSSGQKEEQSPSTVNDCGIPQSAQSLNVPALCSVFDLMMAHCS